MLAKCINLLCFASFRNFAERRLFQQLETDPPAHARGTDYFWKTIRSAASSSWEHGRAHNHRQEIEPQTVN
jgi:hypothetical protein